VTIAPDRASDPPASRSANTAPERLLDGLTDAQRAAVCATSGPLAIIAGAGSGKTRVISHRAAYAIETGVVPADRILLVTFTDKAATEMVERMASLGHPRVLARTFHAAALAQLRHFWPSRHDGARLAQIASSKGRLLFPLASRLPGHYRFTPLKDLAETIEWAKVRRIRPQRWLADGGDHAPIPADLFARLYADYERSKARAGVIDFEDMLVETVNLLETDDEAGRLVRSRKTWFSVDEYQDTNPLAERLLELWLGESRDLAVVGDPDQTIYTFTGASPDFLLGFAERHPGAKTVALVDNYRSSPEILALANRLTAPGPRGALRSTRPSGPAPSIRRFADDELERTALVDAIRGLIRDRVDPAEIAVLVRINAQLPDIEQALTRAGIAFQLRGQRFFERPEVVEARRLLRRARLKAVGPALPGDVRALFVQRLGLGDGLTPGSRGEGGEGGYGGDEARERSASLELLAGIVADLASRDAALTLAEVLAELDRRDTDEAAGSANGVNLLTYHRAKGLEWDAVFLPALEEGLVPVRQAKEDDAIAEERRLLYVGITRARRHLALSWAARRVGPGGKEGRRERSRFLDALERHPSGGPQAGGAGGRAAGSDRLRVGHRVIDLPPAGVAEPVDSVDRGLLEGLQVWRRDRARRDAMPAFVVAHDATLLAIAEARPASLAALRRVRGMGQTKLERYGDEILAVIAARRG
jgi:DNA helicase-2/ATP-dependent DNA helicase PcrA